MDDTSLLSDFSAFVRGVTGEEPPVGLLTEALEIAKSWEKGDAWAVPDDNGGNTTKESDSVAEGAGTPPSSFPREMLRKADFVRLSDAVVKDGGTNCGNCRHMKDGACQFNGTGVGGGVVDLRGLRVTPKDCCAEWDADGVSRIFSQKKSARLPWYVAKNAGPHDYATTMLLLDDAGYSRSNPLWDGLEKLRAAISDEDWAGDGREDELHLTVKYGLMTSDPEEVRRYVRSFGRVRATLGKTAYFPAGDGGEADVVYVEVAGNGPRDLNVLVDGSVPNEDQFPTYTPHVTLAYVRPGLGAEYAGMTDVEGVDLEWDTLTFADPQGNRTKIKLDDPEAPSEKEADPQRLVEVPDVRQEDNYSCGAACAMCVGRYFGVGPETLEEWKAALGTTEETSTLPAAVVDYLDSLGLEVTARNDLTLEDLTRAWRQGKPVICCVQEYGVPSKQASYKYGHYVVVIGRSLGHVFVQDPSVDNLVSNEHRSTMGLSDELVAEATSYLEGE